MSAEFHSFDEREPLFEALADKIAMVLADAIASRGHASLVVSGGSTPADLYDRLCRRELEWRKVAITLSDERWVPVTSERSNEKLVRSRLLKHRAAPAHLVPLKADAVCAADAVAEIDARVSAMARPFDLTLLGMGEDGHTASLIPGADGLNAALDTESTALVRTIVPPEATGMGERVTLTLRALLDSRRICILIRGEEKRAAFERVMRGDDVREAPVRAVLMQSFAPVEIFWAP